MQLFRVYWVFRKEALPPVLLWHRRRSASRSVSVRAAYPAYPTYLPILPIQPGLPIVLAQPRSTTRVRVEVPRPILAAGPPSAARGCH